MSQSHLSANLDKIIQLISIEQIMGLMKQMKTGVDIATTTTNSSKEKEEFQVPKFECVLPDKMNDQLERINNTLLLIVDKISAIESEIQTLKECKQRSKSDIYSEFNEEHIVLKIEEKDVDFKTMMNQLPAKQKT
jgi:prefoldin subunit 5